jgi:isocitrate/isopropylmalate dehydrogenase
MAIYQVAAIGADGIGGEVAAEALKVVQASHDAYYLAEPDAARRIEAVVHDMQQPAEELAAIGTQAIGDAIARQV